MSRTDRAQHAILRALAQTSGAIGASRIVESLRLDGLDLSPRAIRFHLLETDRKGWTQLVTRRAGRAITAAGREALAGLPNLGATPMIAARIEELIYQTRIEETEPARGSVVVNATFLLPANLPPALNEIRSVFHARLGVGQRLLIAQEGEKIGDKIVPPGYLGIGTLCTITISGCLQRRGIPVFSRFGGLLEIRDRKPFLFTARIDYKGSTLDPLEVFIMAGMTRVRETLRTGNGVICASFREVPVVALPDVERAAVLLRRAGIGGILAIGRPSAPLFGVQVSEGHVGIVVAGGVNAIAAVAEAGFPIRLVSLAGIDQLARFKKI